MHPVQAIVLITVLWADMTKLGRDPRQQLADAERLCQVVIRPGIKAPHDVIFMGEASHEDHWRAESLLTQAGAEVPPVPVWQPHIEDHKT